MSQRHVITAYVFVIITLNFLVGIGMADVTGGESVEDISSLTADLTGDRRVDFLDFRQLAMQWQLNNLQVDLTGDGHIDISDIVAFSGQWLLSMPDDGKADSVIDYRGLDSERFPPAGWGGMSWHDPGGWTTIDVTQHGLLANKSNLDASVWLEWIIANVSPGTRRKLYFPAGTYYFKTRCDITVGDIWIEGEGNDQSIFLCQWSPDVSSKEGQLYIRSSNTYTDYHLASDVNRGDSQISLQSSQDLSVGDFVLIYRDGITWNWPMYSQMVKVVNKSGNTLTVDKEFGIKFPVSRGSIVRKMNLLENIKISDLYIAQTASIQTGLFAIKCERIVNAEVNGLATRNFSRRHISFLHSRDVIVRDNDMRGAAGVGTGDGDYGYGIEFWSVSFGMIINNYLENLRHHVCIQAANHCVFAYNIAMPGYIDYCDLNDHGRGGHNNLWEGNCGKEIMFDSYHDASGLYHTYFRNRATYRVGGQEDITDPAYNETRYNIIANECPTNGLVANGAGNYVGGNVVDGTTSWGAISGDYNLPPSLYTEIRPSFLSENEWPLYGPCVIQVQRMNLADMNLIRYDSVIESDYVSVSTVGFARAAGTFVGESSTYDIHIQYGDEPDGSSTFRLYVDHVLIDEWVADDYSGGSWIDWRTRIIADVKVNRNAEIRIESNKNNGENGRVKWVEIVPFTFGVERAEAEEMDLFEYVVEGDRIVASGLSFARASGVFIGDSGVYDIQVNYGDEPDGASTFKVYVDDILIDQWVADDYAGSNWIDWRNRIISNVVIEEDSIIRIESNKNSGENGRVNWFEILN